MLNINFIEIINAQIFEFNQEDYYESAEGENNPIKTMTINSKKISTTNS